jgi:hypothetical protein
MTQGRLNINNEILWRPKPSNDTGIVIHEHIEADEFRVMFATIPFRTFFRHVCSLKK